MSPALGYGGHPAVRHDLKHGLCRWMTHELRQSGSSQSFRVSLLPDSVQRMLAGSSPRLEYSANMPVTTSGPVFTGFKRVLSDVHRKPLSPETENCSKEIVEELEQHRTTSERPGMLLGRIQSGKTRAFVGAIAIAF